ncbi:MAG: folate-binding protein [Pseudomonadota bacterium]
MHDPSRAVICVTGDDREKFLQDMVTNDLSGLDQGIVYAALLSPQGKFLFDFFLVRDGDSILVDVAKDRAPHLAQRLNMYRLRADVAVAGTEIEVSRGLGPTPPGAFADPRSQELGWRGYDGQLGAPVDWDKVRVQHCVPKTGVELIADQSFILECGFERLNGVDFRKGCYVGQEVTARMHHKTTLNKGLVTVKIDKQVPVGTPITSDGKEAGVIYTQFEDAGIAYLRFGRAKGTLMAGDAKVEFTPPS